jgi:hypothetical protein
MSAHRIFSLKDVAEVVNQNGDFSHTLRDFLDGFYSDPAPEKIQDEPEPIPEPNHDGFADSYLAAVGDHLCRHYQYPRPNWIRDPNRILKVPYFAAKTHRLRMVYLQESPPAFKERNIFVSANSISRV